MSRALGSSVLGWTLLVVALVLYGAGGRYAPYVILALLPIIVVHLVTVRAGRPMIPDLAGAGFLAAFGLLTLAFALSAKQPNDVLIVANFSWLLLFIPLQSELKRIAWPGAGVALGRLALLGAIVTLSFALYERTTTGTDRVGVLTSDPIRIANTAVVFGFLALSGLIADRGWRRAIYLLGPVLAVAVALLAGTRGAIAAIAVLAAIAPILALRDWRAAAGAATGLAALAIVALLIAAQLQVPRIDAIARTMWELVSGQPVTDVSVAIRLSLLSAGWNAFLASPLFGHGWQHLITAITPFLPPNWDTQGSPHLHNDIADFAVAGGLMGLVAYGLILATPIVVAVRSRQDALYRVRLFAILMLVASYAVLGINSLMFGYEIHTSLYCLACAAILGFVRETSSIEADATSPVLSRRPAGRVEIGLAWLLPVLALVVINILGLVTPFVIVGLGLVLWLTLLAMGRLPESYSELPAKLMLAAFAILAVAFTVTLQSPRDPLFAFNFVALLLFGPFLTLFARAAGDRLRVAVVIMAVIGVAATLAMSLYMLSLGSGRPTGFNVGPIVMSNAALALAVVATTGAFVFRSRLSLALPLTIGVAIAVILVTLSRGPLIAVLPLLVFTAVMLWRERLQSRWVYAVVGTAVAIVLVVAAMMVAGDRISGLPARLWAALSGGGIDDTTTNIRLSLYRAGWQAFLEAPLFGHGWARLMSAALPYVDPIYLEHAKLLPQLHNDVINFAVAGGVVGVAAYVLIVTAPLVAALRSPHDAFRAARLYATGGLFIVYVCGGLTDLMFGHEFHTALFVILNAIVLGAYRDTTR
jgi:O-antigen ligase